MITINYLAIILMTVVSFVGGYIWFSSALFGNVWMKIHGSDKKTSEQLANDMKGTWAYMVTEFIVILVMNYILYLIVVESMSISSALMTTTLLWLGFVLTTNISTVIWGGDDKHSMVKKILISSIFRLIVMLLSAYVFFIW